MSWEPLKTSLGTFDRLTAALGVEVGDDAPVAPQLAVVREFLADHNAMTQQQLLAKWNGRDFKIFQDSAIVVGRLTEAVVLFEDQPQSVLRSRLKQVLSGSLTQDFSPQQAKDFFYEFEIAALFKRAGFTVALREPDVVVSGNGLSGELGMACKYPSSDAQIHAHISKGYRQIAGQAMDGCVVIGLDLIVFRAAFASPPRFLDFRQGERHPLDVANSLVSDAMKSLVAQREQDYPSEKPVDGAIVTLSMWGIWGKPAGLTSVTAWAVQCDAGNPRRADIGRLVDAGIAQPSQPL